MLNKNTFNIYTTEEHVKILIIPGKKSEKDFIVKYQQPGKRIRTPKHIHLIIDLFLKKAFNRELTLSLVENFLDILSKLYPAQEYPPTFQYFSKEKFERFNKLNGYGEYSVEFIAAIFELIMIQEKTNYPNGKMNKNLFLAFLNEKDIHSIVSTATFR